MATDGAREDDDDAWLIAAERALARRDRSWPGGLAALLHEDFAEIGASGRRWDRAATVALLTEDEPPWIEPLDPVVQPLAAEVRLLMYETHDPAPGGRHVWRASIWVRDDGGWKIRYHLGTIVPPDGR